MPKNPADDVPAPSVQDEPVMHTGAACPSDGTLVTCSGLRSENYLTGRCVVCQRVVYADAKLVTQMGAHLGEWGAEGPRELVDTREEQREDLDGKAARQ